MARDGRLTGRDGIPDWEFYGAFALFRLATLCQGTMGRAWDGTAADPGAPVRGAAQPRAEAGWTVVESVP